jgi:hypothetical protein
MLNGLNLLAQPKEIYTWFDDEVGLENSVLYNGVEFINLYNPINNKHRFFKTSTFSNGEVTYNDQTFYNVSLRYDLFEDHLIVKIENQKGRNQILLLKEKIERFRIGETQFEKIGENEINNAISSGFYELLTENDFFKLYKWNRKELDKGIKNDAVYYEFNEIKPVYIVKTNSEFFEVKRKRDLTKKYPEFKSELSNFRWSSKNFEKNDNQLILAINRLGQLLD